MLRFMCYKCGCRLKVRKELAGKHSRCPICSALNVVPESSNSPMPVQGKAPAPLTQPLAKKVVEPGRPINAKTRRPTQFTSTTSPSAMPESENKLLKRLGTLRDFGIISRIEFQDYKDRVYHLPKQKALKV